MRRFTILALVLIVGACGTLGLKADTPLKKWAVAQDSLTLAVNTTADLLINQRIDLDSAIRLDLVLDGAQAALDEARAFIRDDRPDDALARIAAAVTAIDTVMQEIRRHE